MDITLYIPYIKPPHNIPFNRIEDLGTFCYKYQSKGIFENNQYIFDIDKPHIGGLFFLIINNNDSDILTIPIPYDENNQFILKIKELTIKICFQHKSIINKKNIFSRLSNRDTPNNIIPKIKQIIIKRREEDTLYP